jgi:hypothetical protein
MNKNSIRYLCSAMFLGLVTAAGPTLAQDDPDSVDCFYTSNNAEAACQTTKPAHIAAKSTASKMSAMPEYSETVAESVDCFYSENDAEAACSARKAKSASTSRTVDKVVRNSNQRGS